MYYGVICSIISYRAGRTGLMVHYCSVLGFGSLFRHGNRPVARFTKNPKIFLSLS